MRCSRTSTRDTETLIGQAKAHFDRPRPPDAPQTHGSYPSGHAAFAACAAILLGQMVPEKTQRHFRSRQHFCGKPDHRRGSLPERRRGRMDFGHRDRGGPDAPAALSRRFHGRSSRSASSPRLELGRGSRNDGRTKVCPPAVHVLRRPGDVVLQPALPGTGRTGRRRGSAPNLRMPPRRLFGRLKPTYSWLVLDEHVTSYK